MNKNRILAAFLFVVMLFATSSAYAHGVWFAMRCDRTQLVCGEGWKDNGYDPNGLIRMNGYDAAYGSVEVKPINGENYFYIKPDDKTSVVYVELDYGFWSNSPDGTWIPKPMTEVEGSTIGTHALKYSVNYLKGVEKIAPISGVLYQLVPSVDPTELAVGEEFKVQLLNGDKPMANVAIIPDVLNHHTETIKTDENGFATVKASNGGLNVIGCEMVVPYENEGIDKKATRSKVFVSLSFTLYPPEED